mmetsp:Transcript_23902/g.68384  ORF Transcript_23902/g.68384 Transcript_23902/m.68384 type:complete len:271 (-) Transcript_23902:21-833(-)
MTIVVGDGDTQAVRLLGKSSMPQLPMEDDGGTTLCLDWDSLHHSCWKNWMTVPLVRARNVSKCSALLGVVCQKPVDIGIQRNMPPRQGCGLVTMHPEVTAIAAALPLDEGVGRGESCLLEADHVADERQSRRIDGQVAELAVELGKLHKLHLAQLGRRLAANALPQHAQDVDVGVLHLLRRASLQRERATGEALCSCEQQLHHPVALLCGDPSDLWGHHREAVHLQLESVSLQFQLGKSLCLLPQAIGSTKGSHVQTLGSMAHGRGCNAL